MISSIKTNIGEESQFFDIYFSLSFIKSPLDQFEIRNLLSIDAPILANLNLSLTNIGLYLTITAFAALVLNF